ncbi:SAM-dependent chlorinase/fluorinase [Luteolibacter arcticus]|uniref:SAM-dependent chlorinase/fluorinase n=1 Tax=Luteolibacter arcticus TaxID=1581411 RepID=A0ABT3GPL1_9BACT|nr:SAM hydroxide adenosyltransferase [Luteolibacter arcticus]MCW1925471.1 SAM-dependent chlorinase/fluorinase [Luteolibacter arcticus]
MKALVLAIVLFAVHLHAAEVVTGEIDGAKYMFATPEKWEGKLVLIAHGYRAEDQPLKADFEIDKRFATPLLDKGWAIASTSYRRNGWIIEDAITDLKVLRDHIAAAKGGVNRCILVGSSMGGLISTLAAEGAIDNLHGVVAIGAYLGDRETGAYYQTLSWKPKVPVLFLTNETELDHPRHYREKAGAETTALWEIKRPGHCNVSAIERYHAVVAVDGWIDGTAPEKDKDGTVRPPARKSTAAKQDGGLAGKITFVSASFGNLSSDLVSADLDTLKLKPGDKAIVKSGAAQLEATVALYRTDVEEGKTAVYVTPDGWVAIVINGGNAAEALQVKKGERVTIYPAPAPAEEKKSE